jgi:hypothetical protein
MAANNINNPFVSYIGSNRVCCRDFHGHGIAYAPG